MAPRYCTVDASSSAVEISRIWAAIGGIRMSPLQKFVPGGDENCQRLAA